MGEFKDFLINENSMYLGQRMGDILNAMQELEEEGPNMGKRQLVKHTERLVSMIRRILHSSWPKKNTPHLEGLQKVGVALMKTIDEKGELAETLSGANAELQKILGDMKVPVHQLGSENEKNPKDQDGVDKPQHKDENKPQEPPQQPPNEQQPPDGGEMPGQQQPPIPQPSPMTGPPANLPPM